VTRWPTKPERAFRPAFTLIELLVVMAVIAVLTAILLPCLRTAKAMARRTVCSGRLRQIGTAWALYLNDSRGLFYQAQNANVKFGGWPGLMGYMPRPLNPYVRLGPKPSEAQASVFRCPADCGGIPDRDVLYEMVYRVNGNSFQANLFLIGQNRVNNFTDDPNYWDAVRVRMVSTTITAVGNPSRVLLAGDFGWFNQWNPLVSRPPDQAEWHGRADSYNMVFLDGHLAFVRIEQRVPVSEEYAVVPFRDLWTWRLAP